MRARKPPFAREKLLAEHMRQAARLREFAASATTGRLKARLLEEATAQEQLAEKTKQDSLRAI